MSFAFRPVQERDIPRICGFASNPGELFFFFPAATWPLTHEQLRDSIAQRSDSTVIERDGQVLGFANFYQWETQGTCTIGNVIVDPEARGARRRAADRRDAAHRPGQAPGRAGDLVLFQ